MPFTPFHFGPHACAGLPFGRRIDLPVFLMANVAVDVEPLLVMTLGLDYPTHGYAHTLLFGAGVGVVVALFAWPFRGVVGEVMKALRLPYDGRIRSMVLSGVLGVWLHVLFDAMLYADVHTFFPIMANPLRGIISSEGVHQVCRVCFPVAVLLYVGLALFRSRRKRGAGA